MEDWGFDFARIPMSYWSWSDRADWMKIDERADRFRPLLESYGIELVIAPVQERLDEDALLALAGTFDPTVSTCESREPSR